MKLPDVKEWAAVAAVLLFLAAGLYGGTAWTVFRWRNPTANDMSFYRDWWSVMTWKKVPGYQREMHP